MMCNVYGTTVVLSLLLSDSRTIDLLQSINQIMTV